MKELLDIARKSIEEYIKHKRTYNLQERDYPFKPQRAACFVSLKKEGRLRGCIGTLEPTEKDLIQETIRNAQAAATRDTRFPPVTLNELDLLNISVDILSEPVPALFPWIEDPKKFGIIVKKGFRRGVLLPDIETVDTPDEQFRISCMKAGLDYDEPGIEVMRFTVTRIKP